eukprot:c9353_g1_i1 orf=87-1898(+)
MRQKLCVSYASLLKVSIHTAHLLDGRILHFLITAHELDTLSFLGAHLIRLYSACGILIDASHSFLRLPNPNVFAWSAIISANAKLGHPHNAIMLYSHMHLSCAHLHDAHVVVAALNACTALSCLHLGSKLHVQIVARGLMSVDIVGNTLLNMYIKCGGIAHAGELFDRLVQRDTVTWNTMISGYADYGYGEPAFHVFRQMMQEDMQPDHVTFIAILKASTFVHSLKEGSLTHSLIVEFAVETLINIGSSLVDMYASMGSLEDAHAVFFHLPEKNIVTWTAMAAGYTQNGRSEEALQFFQQMQQEGLRPDRVTLISILQACSTVVGFNQGKAIHIYLLDQEVEVDAMVGCALIDMYFKCGSIKGASIVFAEMPRQGVIAWNTMIAGCAQHGAYNMAVHFFEDMHEKGIAPDDTTFVSLLSACSHAGNLELGCCSFESMRAKYGLAPALDHYMCMVDLLGRAGCVNEAEALLRTMPFQSCDVGWRSLLTHCRTWGKVDLAKICFDHLSLLDANEPTMYALMLEVYASANLREDWTKIDEMKNSAVLWKAPGVAFVEVGKKVHGFTVGDQCHFDSEFLGKLNSLKQKLRIIGHLPLLVASLVPEVG